jgi:hypothetical protein
VFQDLSGTPLAGWVGDQLRRRHGRDGCGNLCLQFLQTRVHEVTYLFRPFG